MKAFFWALSVLTAWGAESCALDLSCGAGASAGAGEVIGEVESLMLTCNGTALTSSVGERAERGTAFSLVVRHIQALLSEAGMCHRSDSVSSGIIPLWISLE